MDEQKKITVVINGKDYFVNHTESDEYVLKIGQYVSKKIQETSVGGMKLVEEKATVMACINIADDYFKTWRQLQDANKELETLRKEKRELELKLARNQGHY